MVRFSGIIWVDLVHSLPYKRETVRSELERERLGDALEIKDEVRSQDCWSPPEAKKGKEAGWPTGSEGTQHADTSQFA